MIQRALACLVHRIRARRRGRITHHAVVRRGVGVRRAVRRGVGVRRAAVSASAPGPRALRGNGVRTRIGVGRLVVRRRRPTPSRAPPAPPPPPGPSRLPLLAASLRTDAPQWAHPPKGTQTTRHDHRMTVSMSSKWSKGIVGARSDGQAMIASAAVGGDTAARWQYRPASLRQKRRLAPLAANSARATWPLMKLVLLPSSTPRASSSPPSQLPRAQSQSLPLCDSSLPAAASCHPRSHRCSHRRCSAGWTSMPLPALYLQPAQRRRAPRSAAMPRPSATPS
jgi:hypothetical protein